MYLEEEINRLKYLGMLLHKDVEQFQKQWNRRVSDFLLLHNSQLQILLTDWQQGKSQMVGLHAALNAVEKSGDADSCFRSLQKVFCML